MRGTKIVFHTYCENIRANTLGDDNTCQSRCAVRYLRRCLYNEGSLLGNGLQIMYCDMFIPHVI